MKTTNAQQGRVFGWSVRFGMAAVAVAIASSGFAQPSNDGSGNNKKPSVRGKVMTVSSCYVYLSGSPFPQPADRLSANPSTASPMQIIGEAPVLHCRR